MIITLDSISKPENISKIASQLLFLFNKLDIDCQAIADQHIMDLEQLDTRLLTYNRNKILLLLPITNKEQIKSEMIINSHLVCTFMDNFEHDLDQIAIADNEKFDVIRPGNYSSYIWEQKKLRASYTKHNFDWKIYKNYSAIFKDGKKINSEMILRKIAKKIGCEIVQGVASIDKITNESLFGDSLNMNQLISKQEIISLARSFDSDLVKQKLSEKL